ncbi:MAG: LCP family protein [Ktedonobacteraceae bacterium]
MSYENEPTQKLSPKPWQTTRKHIPLSPMPALEELVPRHRWGPEQVNQPTEPIPLLHVLPARTHPAESAGTPLTELANTRAFVDKRKSRPRIKSLKKPQQRPRRRSPMSLSLLLLLLLLGGLSFSGWYFIETTILGPLAQFFHPIGSGGSIDGRAWNLLLLGSDNDAKYVFPNVLTQVVMVVHVDPVNQSVSLVSLPRDSWLPVSGQAGLHKLDQAFFLGATSKHSFNTGVRVARATIEHDYGIAIDRYIWVGLGGFAKVIDTLGGIDIDLTHPLLDGTYPDDTGPAANPHDPYAFKRLYLPPGPQHLNGEGALEYVRSRHADLVGDIGRTQRQQEVVTALKGKLNATSLFDHLPQLLHDLAGKVYTDLSQNELLSMGNFARNLAPRAISRITLGPGSGRLDYGTLTQINDPDQGTLQDIVIPNCANIQPTINKIFGLGDVQSCQMSGPGG